MTTTPAIRTAAAMSDAELRASAWGRVDAAAQKYGADSPQVKAALARWARIDAARVEPDDLTALVDAIGATKPHQLDRRSAARAIAWSEQYRVDRDRALEGRA